jgi:hypothetical protein
MILKLKVMNGFSNTSMTHMLRYVTDFIDHIYMIMIKVIFVPLKNLLLVHQ